FSGVTLDRPALNRLLADVAARHVDVILVYKVDRLSRSLFDFAKLVEIFEKSDASFVSITQAFNTTSSMGRLTLNMLLSFAQFEREVTGERIRDKIAASKAKGMWMGGVVPLGYRVDARKLLVEETEADTVRLIFKRYLKIGSVQALQAELATRGIMGRARMRRGELVPPKPMSRGALYLMLSNRIYVGEVVHREKHFPGEHAAILDTAVFNAAQTMLATNRNGHQSGASFDQPSLLVGLLWDEHGRRMSPTHSQKGPSRRYRYYVSRNDGPAAEQPIMRAPAADIEAVVVGRLHAMLMDEGALMDAVARHELDAVALNGMLFECRRQAERLNSSTPGEVRKIIARHISRIDMLGDRVVVHVLPISLIKDANPAAGPAGSCGEKITLMVMARLGRIGKEVRLVVDPSTSAPISAASDRRDPALIKLIVKAHAARAALMATPQASVEDIAKAQGYDRYYFGVLLRLSWLAPDISNSMLEGRQPAALNRQSLARMAGLSLRWDEQRHSQVRQ
ncbi:MAG: recombinase family protein, partial [Sphingomonadales bacterium]|nr:recombinase family protein [Sphingomonadales bacterium]